jgi:hypothetical protein
VKKAATRKLNVREEVFQGHEEDQFAKTTARYRYLSCHLHSSFPSSIQPRILTISSFPGPKPSRRENLIDLPCHHPPPPSYVPNLELSRKRRQQKQRNQKRSARAAHSHRAFSSSAGSCCPQSSLTACASCKEQDVVRNHDLQLADMMFMITYWCLECADLGWCWLRLSLWLNFIPHPSSTSSSEGMRVLVAGEVEEKKHKQKPCFDCWQGGKQRCTEEPW